MKCGEKMKEIVTNRRKDYVVFASIVDEHKAQIVTTAIAGKPDMGYHEGVA